MAATATGNENLLKLLSAGDLATNELYYHRDCYKELVNEYNRKSADNSSKETDDSWIKATAFSTLVDYILLEEEANPGSVFKVIDLENIYVEQLKKYGIKEASHTTRCVNDYWRM